MATKETFMGCVEDVTGSTVRVSISKDSLTGFVYIEGQGYRIGQVGSFVRIPIGFSNLYGIIAGVGASAAPDKMKDELPQGKGWMTIQLIGEALKSGVFQRGLSQFPTAGDEVHLVTERELKNIYGEPDKPYFVKLGHIANADSISALVDVNKLVTRHSAVVGTTGSGKSTTVAGIMNALTDGDCYPSARILILDVHGEYGNALRDRATIFKINADKSEGSNEQELYIPFWALNSEELCELSFGDIQSEKDKNVILESIINRKRRSMQKYHMDGVDEDNLGADTPVPFNIHHLWYEFYVDAFGTYYKHDGKEPKDNLAYAKDDQGNELKGDPDKGIPPSFRHLKNEKDDKDKVFQLPSSSVIGLSKQITLLGAKLRIPRYDFVFDPGPWAPKADGKVKSDLDELLKQWVGSKKISILDLSGVPIDILQTIIGAVLRILYEALFWSRNLSQGGRNRPLLLVMEEAHLYLNTGGQNMASSIVKRIVKEGRKYGIGAMIVSQRPSEVDPTILSQCGTFFALRLANATDRGHITSALSDNLEGLTNMLPTLRTGEAIILGESVKLPMRTYITAPPRNKRPDSSDPVVYDVVPSEDSQIPGGWGIPMEEFPNYKELIEAWRAQNPKIKRVK